MTFGQWFCSKLAISSFVGYAYGQLKRMEKFCTDKAHLGEKRKKLIEQFGYDTKNASHLVRLLRMGIEFVETGDMQVYRTDDAQELIDIKRGKWSLEKVKQLSDRLFEQLESVGQKSPLPEEPDYEGAEKLLISIMRITLSGLGRTFAPTWRRRSSS